MRTTLLLLTTLGLLLTMSCTGGSSTTVGPVDLADHHSAGPPCPDPGPAPGAPTLLQQGTLRNRRGVIVGTFDMASGPELWPDADGCEHWALNAHLNVTRTTGGDVRLFTKLGYYGRLQGTVTFTEDPSDACPNPTGNFTFTDSGKGLWYFRDRGCGGSGPNVRLQGTWTSP